MWTAAGVVNLNAVDLPQDDNQQIPIDDNAQVPID